MMTLAMNKSSQTLLSCIEQVVMEWAFLSLDYLGEPGLRPAKLPLERRIRLDCDGAGAVIVLRGSFGLGLELARSVRGLPSSNLAAGEAAFSELCSLVAEEWRRRQGLDSGKECRVLGIEASSPETWPQSKPEAAVVATVRGLAIEVLLWSPHLAASAS